MRPTPEERAYLLRCAKAWDTIAGWWRGPLDVETGGGLCNSLHRHSIELYYGGRGRVPSAFYQCRNSRPPHTGTDIFWWPEGTHRKQRAAHAAKLARRCRTLAAQP